MFKFNFDVDEIDEPVADAFGTAHSPGSHTTSGSSHPQDSVREDPSKEVPVQSLLNALPHTFSFSPSAIPLASKRNLVLSRRDLFDARFQLIATEPESSTNDGPADIDFLDAPSDLVPGVYEGGLKTWECSLDLIDCLDSIYGTDIALQLKGKRILELGCGTAVPCLYLLHSVFSAEPSASSNIHIHLQDYNELVLRLITLPNVILAWYMSPGSSTFRSGVSTASNNDTPEAEAEPFPLADATEPGEIPITPALTAAFLKSLDDYGIHLRFFAGSWSAFDVEQAGGSYHMVLTSETIYRTDSLPSLVNLLQRASAVPPTISEDATVALSDSTSRLSVSDQIDLQRLSGEPYLCLVAAKLVYFGVGGGVNEFVQAVEGSREQAIVRRGDVRTIWERTHGVKRSIMQVKWNLV
ncbi:hypothetical protein C8Q79DRAFT_963605 [Trametes meyenii]|nr:hypothetical protein C8Q79DRAFT_963605 [Trametes meyenii]